MAENLYDLEHLSYRELARRNVSRVNNLLLLFTAVVTIATVAALYIAVVRG